MVKLLLGITQHAAAMKFRQTREAVVPLVGVTQEVAKNLAMGVPSVRRARLRHPRAGALFTGCNKLIERYAFQALRALLEHGEPVEDRSVVEFGPGDNLSSGLSLLAAGAASYTVLDRFVPDYSSAQAKRWYLGVAEAWPRYFPDVAWPDWLDAGSFPEALSDRVGFVAGSVEEARPEGRFDLVCSFQVGEHVDDVSQFARLTTDLVASNGLAIHRVDFGPHDCWKDYNDPLTFLRFPSVLWSAMGSNRGTPNRVRHHEFLDAFAAAGLQVECVEWARFASQTVNVDRLPRRFRTMPIDSLLTRSVTYLCRPS